MDLLDRLLDLLRLGDRLRGHLHLLHHHHIFRLTGGVFHVNGVLKEDFKLCFHVER
jgi:hypothetical protein